MREEFIFSLKSSLIFIRFDAFIMFEDKTGQIGIIFPLRFFLIRNETHGDINPRCITCLLSYSKIYVCFFNVIISYYTFFSKEFIKKY